MVGGNRFQNFGLLLYSSIIGWCFKTNSHSALQQRPVNRPRRVLAIGGIFFDSRSIFDLELWQVKGQFSVIFSGKSKLSHFRVDIGRTYER